MSTALLFIIVIVVLIISHELGHFLAAKFCGVQVDEFGLGFPPRIFGKKWGSTLYSLNWLPFGGFVSILGEDSAVNLQEDRPGVTEFGKRNFVHEPAYRRIFILIAGVTANLLLAWGLLTVSLQTGLLMPVDSGIDEGYITNRQVSIGYVVPNSPAAGAGMLEGDRIISATDSGREIAIDSPEKLTDILNRSNGEPVTISLSRDISGDTEFVTLMPETISDGGYRIGVALVALGEARLPITFAIVAGASLTVDFTKGTVVGFYNLISGFFAGQEGVGEVSGPVGIYNMVGSASGMGLAYILAFMALLSINLAVLNILPIPALDGGRIAVIIVESIKGSPIRQDIILKIHQTGFVLLIALMAVVTLHDIVKLF